MRPKRKRHPNYKVYLSHQLRILQEKFPFLSSQQIKAKICSTWDRFSPQKKDDWGKAVGRKNFGKTIDSPGSSNESEASSANRAQPAHIIQNCRKSPDIFHDKAVKKVRFTEPIDEDLPEELPRYDVDIKPEQWPLFNDFNTIMEHKLDMEEGIPVADADTKESEDPWSLLGDCNVIMNHTFDDKCVETLEDKMDEKDNSTEKDGLMCSLFEDINPKVHFCNKRLLSCYSPSEGTTTTRLFEEDEQFFA